MSTRLREIRAERGFTQTELSKASGVSRVSINQIENEVRPCIKTSTIIKLAKALGVEPNDLFPV